MLRAAGSYLPGLPGSPDLPGLPGLPGLLAAGLLLASCGSSPPPEPKDYAAKIAGERAAKDAQFAAGDDPVPAARHKDLLPLAYFPIDPEYNVPGALKRLFKQMPVNTAALRRRLADEAVARGGYIF